VKDKLAQFLTRLLKPLIEIRPGERLKTLVMFTYFLLIIATIWILKPVRDSLFLEEFGAGMLRYAYVGEGVFMAVIVFGFIQLSKNVSRKFFYAGVFGFYIVCLLLFWGLFRLGEIPYLPYLFYIWVASYSIAMTTIFWLLANDIFNISEAKRLFGLILSGGSIGGALGGLITERFAVILHTENLLLVAVAILGICISFVAVMWKSLLPASVSESSEEVVSEPITSTEQKTSSPSAKKLFTGSSYLLMLAGLIIIAKVTSTVIDNQFKGIVEVSILGLDAKTAFFGGFYKWLNVVAFLSQILLTTVTLRYLGVGISLWILPVGLMLGSVFSFMYPILIAGCAVKIFDGAGNYSIQQACREVLYIPVPTRVRYKVKPVIDMLGFRLAKSLGGIFIISLAPLFNLSNEKLGALIWILIPFWCFLAWKMKSGYSKLLRERLIQKDKFDETVKAQRATDVLSFLHDEKDFHEIEAFMNHRSSYARKLAAAAYFAYAKSKKSIRPTKNFIKQMIQQEAFEQIDEQVDENGLGTQDMEFLENLMAESGEVRVPHDATLGAFLSKHSDKLLIKLGSVLRDVEQGLATKRRAIRIIELIPQQESADLLLHTLSGAQNHAFRFVMIKALNQLHDKNPDIAMNRFLIKNEISRESKIHEKIKKIIQFYYESVKKPPSEDYLGVALKAISEESMERIFHYLNLLYSHEAIQVIYARIVESPENDPMRVHAIELLSNTVEPDLLIIIQNILDGRNPSNIKEKEVIKILKSFLKSQDQWFSVAGSFLISDLELDKRWPELAAFERESELPKIWQGM